MQDFSKKDFYRQLAEEHPEWPIFMQPFWLDAVCGRSEDWQAAIVRGGPNDSKTVGAMPFFIEKGFFFTKIGQPPITPWLGVWAFLPENGSPQKRLSIEKEVFEKLLDQLPKTAHLAKINLAPEVKNGLPFHWAGFRIGQRVTYVLKNLGDRNSLFSRADHSVRKNVAKAERQLEVTENGSLEAFFDLLKKTFLRQKMAPPCSFETFQKVEKVLAERGQSAIFYAKSIENGQFQAAAMVIWPESKGSASVLFTASDPAFRQSAAVYFLYWKMIEWLGERGFEELDFEGSMLESVESVYRAFGAEQRSYLSIFRAKNRFYAAALAFFGKG